MKKLTALFTAFLMALTALLVPIQVYATDNEYVLADNAFVPFMLEVLDEKDEKITDMYYYSGLEEGKVTETGQSLYGQFDVKFRLKAKNGVTLKLMRYYEYAGIEDLAKKFADVDTLTLGQMTESYKLVEGDGTLSENRFLIECKMDGKTYYAEFCFYCYAKDYFMIYGHEGNDTNETVTQFGLDNKTKDGETITVDCNVSDNIQICLTPVLKSFENFKVMINGHVNSGREALSEGENYFKVEYNDKTYNLILRRPETTAWTNSFSDVNTSDAFFNSVKYCNMNGLMLGTSDTTFTPDAVTTRAMVVTTLYRIAGSPAVNGTNKFSDVEEGSWYYDAVIWANENGIVLGYDNGKFGTDDNITREQFATIMYRYAKMQNPNMLLYSYVWPYSDADVADYAKEAMVFAVKVGLIKTTDMTNYEAKKNVSRGDLAIGIAAMNTYVLPTLKVMNVIAY